MSFTKIEPWLLKKPYKTYDVIICSTKSASGQLQDVPSNALEYKSSADTGKLQEALNGGGRILIMSGHYEISEPLKMNTEGTTVEMIGAVLRHQDDNGGKFEYAEYRIIHCNADNCSTLGMDSGWIKLNAPPETAMDTNTPVSIRMVDGRVDLQGVVAEIPREANVPIAYVPSGYRPAVNRGRWVGQSFDGGADVVFLQVNQDSGILYRTRGASKDIVILFSYMV